MPTIAPAPERSVAVLVRFQVDQTTRDAVIKLIRHLVGGGAVLRAALGRFRGLLIHGLLVRGGLILSRGRLGRGDRGRNQQRGDRGARQAVDGDATESNH